MVSQEQVDQTLAQLGEDIVSAQRHLRDVRTPIDQQQAIGLFCAKSALYHAEMILNDLHTEAAKGRTI